MNKIFNLDNPVMQLLSTMADMMIVSILWTVCSIPLFTIGPATAALYHVMEKIDRNEASGIVKCFFASFRRNLGQGILLTLILAALGIVGYLDCRILQSWYPAGSGIIALIFGVLGICYLLGACLTFPLLARFDNTVWGMLRNSMLLALGYLPRASLNGLVNLAPLLVFLLAPSFFMRWLPGWLIFAPAVVAWLGVRIQRKIYTTLAPAQEVPKT